MPERYNNGQGKKYHVLYKATGNLSKSLTFKVKTSKNSIELIYTRPAYADYQDQGVSGTQKKYKTPFSYKTSSNVVVRSQTGTFAKVG